MLHLWHFQWRLFQHCDLFRWPEKVLHYKRWLQSPHKICMNRIAASKYKWMSFSLVFPPSQSLPLFFPVDIIGLITKGCASETFCENDLLNTLGSISGVPTTCCGGILCNSGQSLKQSLFLLLVPLLSLRFLWDLSCFWFSGLFVLYQHTVRRM